MQWLTAARMLKAKVQRAPMTDGDTAAGTGDPPHLQRDVHQDLGSGSRRLDIHPLIEVRDPRVRFQNAVRTVIKLQRTTSKQATPIRPGLPHRDTWRQTPIPASLVSDPDPDLGLWALRGTRVARETEKLSTLELSQVLSPHKALVRHVQFSPNGKFFASASWDRTAMVFCVWGTEAETEETESEMGETETLTSFRPLASLLTQHRTLVHPWGFIVQVAWSPNGRLLLTRVTRGIKLWSEDGVCRSTVDRSRTISSAVWLPNGQAILSVEGSEVVKLDLNGKVLDVYHFGHVRLVNVAVTSDCSRLIAIGPSVPPVDGPQPTRQTKIEKRIIVYNMHTKRKESQTPLFHDVRDIMISKRTPVILISFEQAFPQLWKLELVRDRARVNREAPLVARLALKHTFVSNSPTSIASSCYFGGSDEQFVYCVGKAGNVHVWDRDTAALLRYIPPMNMPWLGATTCIGWNNAMEEPMFATGSHDGTVRVWSTRTEGLRSPTVVGSDLDTLVESVGRVRV